MSFGILLRRWRAVRHLSQLNLALDAAISSRHLSCIETGRSQPSRQMVLRLAKALHVPLRERNTLLLAAGYAPLYSRGSLNPPESEPSGDDMEYFIAQLEPNPVLVLDSNWNILRMNGGARRFLALFPGCDSVLPLNGPRLVFHPQGLRPFIENWEVVAARIIHRVQQAVAGTPTDETSRSLLDELLGYPNVPSRWRRLDLNNAPLPFLTINYRWKKSTLRFFSTLMTLGTPLDMVRQELRIESHFPADEGTRMVVNRLVRSSLRHKAPQPNRAI